MERIITVQIPKEAEGIYLENYLRNQLGFTRNQVKSMKFREDGICIDGRKTRVNYILKAGEELRLSLEEKRNDSSKLVPMQEEPDILYEDDDVICVWKKAGVVTHPAGIHYQDSLVNRLMFYFLGKGEMLQIRAIGRLDKDTEGIVVFAKNKIAAARLWKQKEEGLFRKQYTAYCLGDFSQEEYNKEQTICVPLRNRDEYTMEVSVDGKRAVTHYRAVNSFQREGTTITRVSVRIDTGRMHQIRVHMASIGHPLIGDLRYGIFDRSTEKVQNHTFAELCADEVSFYQPFAGKYIELSREQKEKRLD